METDYPNAMAEHLLYMHIHFNWPHPSEYKGIHAQFKAATSGLNDIYSDETITATVEDLIKQHTLVSPEDAADLRRMVNG